MIPIIPIALKITLETFDFLLVEKNKAVPANAPNKFVTSGPIKHKTIEKTGIFS